MQTPLEPRARGQDPLLTAMPALGPDPLAPFGLGAGGLGAGDGLHDWAGYADRIGGAEPARPAPAAAAFRNGLAGIAGTPWGEPRGEPPVDAVHQRDGGVGLWGAGNIWSSGTDADAGRARRSIDVPFRTVRSEESVFSRAPGPAGAGDGRRSLDSLSGLQAIWQAQQQSQAPPSPAFSQPPHPALSQQLGGLRLQEGPLPGALGPQALGGNGGYHHGRGLPGAALSQQLHGLPASLPLAGHYLPPSLQASHALLAGGQAGLGLGLGLGAAQLQAALQDPATAKLLRARLEAAALAHPQLRHQPGLEESLLLARQGGGVHALLSAGGLRQPPPPPPPRASRGQLPPALQKGAPAPPPRAPGAAPNGAKKPAAAAQRTPARDRAALLGSRPKADMGALDRVLQELVQSLRPSAEELAKQAAAFQKVSKLLTARWPHARVHQFGSTANALSICNNNDIDVCLEIVEPEGEPNFRAQLIEEMGDLLTDAGMANVLPLPKARVPVVKFAVPDTATKVDVSVNNMLALTNTRLLADYAAVDGRLLQLAFIVKHWAKRRQVNDSYRGTLSSYCYVLMCIHHLQTREPPVLPCLQAMQPPTHIRTIGRWCCDYYDKPLAGFGAANSESLAELAWSFFENWAWRHDYNNAVVSVRTGSLLTKAQKDWTRRIGNERHLICIEDPFETSHDLGRTVDRQTSGVLHKEFERAACVLRDCEEPLAQLFEPYRAGKAP